MSYSKITDPVIKIRNQSIDVLADGTTVVYGSVYIETKRYRYHWINASELQSEINTIQTTEEADGWIIERQPTRTPVHDTIADLFNTVIDLYRFVSV